MPSTRTRPRSGRTRPTSDFKNTVLPVPEGPSMTLTSPAGSDNETSRQTTWRPKDLVSPSTTTSIPISPPWQLARPSADLRLAERERDGVTAAGDGEVNEYRGQTAAGEFRNGVAAREIPAV